MMVYQPSGSFISFAYRYIDPAWAFTVGWIYVFHCFTIIPLDIIVAAKVTKALLPSIKIIVWLSTFIITVSATALSRTIYFVQISGLLGLTKLIIITGLGFVISFVPFGADEFLTLIQAPCGISRQQKGHTTGVSTVRVLEKPRCIQWRSLWRRRSIILFRHQS